MLIVGDVSTNLIDKEHKVKSVEVLVERENMESLLKQLNLDKYGTRSKTKLSNLATLYHTGGGIKILIIDVGNNLYLKTLIRKAFARHQLKIATPAINYAYLWTYPNIRFRNVGLWEKGLYQAKKLKPYFYKSYAFAKKEQFKLLTAGKRAVPVYRTFSHIHKEPYKFMDFEKYRAHDLSDLLYGLLHNPYKRMTVEHKDHIYIESIFKGDYFTDATRSIAILLKLYLDVINEVFIPEYMVNKKYPDRFLWKTFFKEMIMNNVSDTINTPPFIRQYLIDNYDLLLHAFNYAMLDKFIIAEAKGELQKNKEWTLD